MPYAHTDSPRNPSRFIPGKRYYFEKFSDDDTKHPNGRSFYLTDERGVSRPCIERNDLDIKGQGNWIITEDDETAKPSPLTVPLTILVPLERVSAVAGEFEVIGTP